MELNGLLILLAFVVVYFFFEKWHDVLNFKEKKAIQYNKLLDADKYRKGWHRLDFYIKVGLFLFILFLMFGFSFWVLLTLPLIGSVGWIVGDLSYNLWNGNKLLYVGKTSDIDSASSNVYLHYFMKVFALGVSIGLIVWNWGSFPIGDFG